MIDNDGNIRGQSPDGTVVKGLTLSYFRVKPFEEPLSSDGIQYAVVEIQFKYTEELNDKARYAVASNLDWYPLDKIQPLTLITITPGTVAANAFTAAFAYVDPTTGNTEPVRGLDANGAELTVLDQAGSAVTVTVVETATLGTYTITDSLAGMTSGSVKYNADASTDDFKYSATTAVSAA